MVHISKFVMNLSSSLKNHLHRCMEDFLMSRIEFSYVFSQSSKLVNSLPVIENNESQLRIQKPYKLFEEDFLTSGIEFFGSIIHLAY